MNLHFNINIMKTRNLLIMITISIIVSSKAFSNTIVVTTGNDSITGSLRDAIDKAQSGDEITFDKSLTEIILGEQIIIDKSITISGNPNLLIHALCKVTRIFEIDGSEAITVNINNLKLGIVHYYFNDSVSYETNGGIILIKNTQSTVNIAFCYFVHENNCNSGGIKGAICYHYPNGQVKVFYGQNGGAIAQDGGVLNISNCTFSRLSAAYNFYVGKGGAIYQKSGELNLTNCTFYANTAGYCSCGVVFGEGAAIYSANSIVAITNCTFCENIICKTYDNPYAPSFQDTYTIVLNNSDLAIKNSIFYNNNVDDWTGRRDDDRDIYDSINSGGYNIFQQETWLKLKGVDTSDLFYCNPGFVLKKPSVNSKPIVVLSTSAFWIPVCALDIAGCAIDALPADGNGAPLFDQRGFTRHNAPDIGAYEYAGVNPTGVSANKIDVIKIYPNPSSGIINLQINDQQIHNKVEIYNSLGQIIYSKEIGDNNIEQISLSNKGLFFVRISNRNSFQIKKVIIN
jgi:hypothetical protein